jgi:hypothetical protein
MLFGRQVSRVLVYEHPVDMRKSFDGLSAVAAQGVQEDVLSRSLLRFERGRFEVSQSFLNYRELELLFDGICRRK